MTHSITLNSKNYLSASEAARLAGYTSDYISQLARAGKITAERVGRFWYVDENSLYDFIDSMLTNKEARSQELRAERIAELEERARIEAHARAVASIRSNASYARVDGIRGTSLALQKLSALMIALAFVGSIAAFSASLTWGSTWSVGRAQAQMGAQAVTLATPLMRILSTLAVSTYELFTFSVAAIPTAPMVEKASAPAVPLLQQGIPSVTQNEGLVAFPSTGDAKADEAAKNRIKAAFSDEINVFPDETGQSGLIKPVWRNQNEEQYIYVMVPLEGAAADQK